MLLPDPAPLPALSSPPLTSREVCQWLRDAALGTAHLKVLTAHPGRLSLAIDDCILVLLSDEHHLSCLQAHDAQGRQGTAEQWSRLGTDPIELLSTWERARLERLIG